MRANELHELDDVVRWWNCFSDPEHKCFTFLSKYRHAVARHNVFICAVFTVLLAVIVGNKHDRL